MKTVFGLSQFWHQNETKVAALIGNIALLVSTGSGFLIKAPIIANELGLGDIVSPYIPLAGKILLGAGLLVKMATKCVGTINELTGEPVNTTLPSTVK
jgi:hypothetical protein